MPVCSHIDAIIPAAGLSSRFEDGSKLLEILNGRTLVEHVVEKAIACLFRSVIVVTGHDRERIEAVLANTGATCVYNPNYTAGMGGSIVCGIDSQENAEGYLVWPADMPLIRKQTVEAICKAFDPEKIIAPVRRNERGHPILFADRFREDLLSMPYDTGARTVLNKFSPMIHLIEVDDCGIHYDIDTREQLADCLQFMDVE